METRIRGRARVTRLLSFVALVALAGCVHLNRGEPIQRHYVLGGGAPPAAGTVPPTGFEVAVGVRRLELASYLSAPFIAVRTGSSQISLSEFNRWGEPLDEGIKRVVARNLVRRGLRDVSVAPWPAGARFDYVIELAVVRFEGTTAEETTPGTGGAHLQANWQIVRQGDGEVLARGSTDYAPRSWTVGDYPGLVTLLDAGLEVLAADLFASVEELVTSGRGSSGVLRVDPAG